MNEPTPNEALEFLWQASRKAPLPAQDHVSCQLCQEVLLKILSPEKEEPIPDSTEEEQQEEDEEAKT